jgi:hypothetical protein
MTIREKESFLFCFKFNFGDTMIAISLFYLIYNITNCLYISKTESQILNLFYLIYLLFSKFCNNDFFVKFLILKSVSVSSKRIWKF